MVTDMRAGTVAGMRDPPVQTQEPTVLNGIPAGLDKLCRVVDGLSKHLDELSDRLISVLLDHSTRDDCESTSPEPQPMCQHHRTIETEVERLDSFIHKIKDLMDRLQV